jgi:hypothetical protein
MQIGEAKHFECPECGLKSLEPADSIVFSESEKARLCKYARTG